ncbi:hypothetical protein PG5_00970 [Pseudomonas sp. G5(2012)]|nr:hypothetical protein PG5_00970 [Pseudomonas sp. G5(2012)]
MPGAFHNEGVIVTHADARKAHFDPMYRAPPLMQALGLL